MTSDQFMGLVRQAIPLIGGIAVAMGWLTTGQVARTTEIVLQIGGPLFVLWGIIWSYVANSKESIVQSVAAMPETTVEGNMVRINDPRLATAARKASADAT